MDYVTLIDLKRTFQGPLQLISSSVFNKLAKWLARAAHQQNRVLLRFYELVLM